MVGIVIGLEASFFLIGIILAGILSSFGLPNDILQWVAAAMLVVFAATMLIPALHERFQIMISRLTAPAASALPQRSGFMGGLLAGAPLGLIWAPCAGPILAGITVAGASSSFSGRTVATMAAYGLGMLGPLLAIGLGGRRAAGFFRRRVGSGRKVEIGMGVVLLLTAAMVGFGWANSFNRFLAESVNLTSTPTAELEERALSAGTDPVTVEEGERVEVSEAQLASTGYPELEGLADYGPTPELAGISNWFNSEPSTLRELRGKVVLIDFWTYSCINCIRTFPYLQEWYSKYEDDGFVLLGVHTPEFAFEKEPDNVAAAIEDFGIEYPVALDPDYETWESFSNHYWPAHYLIDRQGVLRSVHYGEGAYERTENEIRHLLSLQGSVAVDESDDVIQRARTPEIYLGYQRAESFAGTVDDRFGLVPDRAVDYEVPPRVPVNWWTYDGTWDVGGESAHAGTKAAIELHYLASDVHIVAGPGSSSHATLTVYDGDAPVRTISIDGHRLYTLRTGDYNQEQMRIEVTEGVEVYSFTFG